VKKAAPKKVTTTKAAKTRDVKQKADPKAKEQDVSDPGMPRQMRSQTTSTIEYKLNNTPLLEDCQVVMKQMLGKCLSFVWNIHPKRLINDTKIHELVSGVNKIAVDHPGIDTLILPMEAE
jgi:hypothetical protein